MKIGDKVKTHLGELGEIVGSALKPYDWNVKITHTLAGNYPNYHFQELKNWPTPEPYRESELTVIGDLC